MMVVPCFTFVPGGSDWDVIEGIETGVDLLPFIFIFKPLDQSSAIACSKFNPYRSGTVTYSSTEESVKRYIVDEF